MSSIEQQQRVILVTRSNKGIGFCIVKKLAEQSSADNTIILLGSRDLKRGQNALEQLGSLSTVHLLEIDMSSKESIQQAVNEIKEKCISPTLTIEELDQLVEDFISAIKCSNSNRNPRIVV